VCVLLASKLGHGVTPSALELAVAAELVHSATLLHDDVVDDAPSRRGATTARIVYGNAISIFAGDWLLVDSLRRVRRAAPPDVLELLLDVIDEMIVAESLQLERRGRLAATFDDWSLVAEGKTAALFRWAMYAGARAGGLDIERATALERFGRELGLAYQAVDDVLDLAGDAALTGKSLFADLREGKGSLPVVFALRSEPTLATALVADSVDLPAVAARITALGALDEARAYATARTTAAIAALTPFEQSEAREAIADIARGLTARVA
jgi:octaprenyl-diphosphate synthase